MKKETLNARANRLMPGNVPRYIRCYDIGADGPMDRYTVVYGKRPSSYENPKRQVGAWWAYVAMSAHPYHPQGFGQHGETKHLPCDRPSYISLGRKIKFTDLPPDCQTLVLSDYRTHWDLRPPEVTAKQACDFTSDILMSENDRLSLVSIANKIAEKWGEYTSFMQFIDGWKNVPELKAFAEVIEFRVFNENHKFI